MCAAASAASHPGTGSLKQWILKDDSGYAMLISVVLSTVMLALGASVMMIASHELKQADRWQKSNEAYFLARAGISEAVYRLKDDYENMTVDGYQGDNTKDLEPSNTKPNRTFSFTLEPVDPDAIHFIGSQFMTGAFRVESVGRIDQENQKFYGIKARIERDTFLRYSRFVQQGNLSYAANAELMADVYVGGDLNLNGAPVTFWGDVAVGRNINHQSRGIFHGDITGTGSGVDLVRSVDIGYYRDLAKGNIADEGLGLYFSGTASIDLSLFDFSGPIVKYNGTEMRNINGTSGAYVTTADFNGIIFTENDVSIKGVLDGRSLTFVSGDDIVAKGNIRTGTTQDAVYTNGPTSFNTSSSSSQTKTININSIMSENTKALEFEISGSKWKKARVILKENGTEIARTDLVRTSYSPDDDQVAVINGNDWGNFQYDPTATYTAEVHYYSNGYGILSGIELNSDSYDFKIINVNLVF